MASTVEELEKLIANVKAAQQEYAQFSQEKVDYIFKKAALAANEARIKLAKMAVEETGMGIVEDKVIKNHFAAEYIFNRYIDEKTCGVIEEDLSAGIHKVAEPIGIIAGVIPVTNPTSTTIFKALLALKTRNGIIFSPHPRARNCTAEAANIVMRAAVAAGAPAGIIGAISEPTVEMTQHVMAHQGISLILATGGPGMVKVAYSSGHPALGVGAGNTPVVIDETAHMKMAVSSILLSKTFDNGMICASEQSVVVVDSIYDAVKAEFKARGAHILSEKDRQKVAATIIQDGKLNAKIVGQSAENIALLAGTQAPKDAKILIGEVTEIGPEEPFSYEKLSPVLAMYRASDFKDAVDKAVRLVEFGGIGHTAVMYTDQRNQDRVRHFGDRLKTGRVLVNMPASQGAIGDIFNFKMSPSLTLGCGSWGGNSISENVGIKHLINVKTVAERRENMLWFQVPPKTYFKYGSLPVALEDIKGRKRAFIVTDRPLLELGYVDRVTKILDELKIEHETFCEVRPDPTLSDINKGLERLKSFKADVIISLGGGSPMDAAKIIWAMYEYPDLEFEGLAMRFMDIRKRIYRFPSITKKALMVAIPTTSGTGSEVTPFAVVTDDVTGKKYPIADYELTPNIAIVDPDFVLGMPKTLAAYGGIDALTHAIEAYVSVLANEFTNGLALEAIRLIFKYLPESYHKGGDALKAREKMHYAATMAGMAFANAFLGVCHSLAHKLGAAFHVPHGLANAMLITHVIDYNKTDVPKKQATFPQYKYPLAKERYGKIADYLGLGGKTPDEKVERLVEAIEKLKAEVGIPKTIRDYGIDEKEFMSHLDDLSEEAFDDQCTGANPRYPSFNDLKEIYIKAYNGTR